MKLRVDYVPHAEPIPVFIGGPVHTGEIFILHGSPFTWKGCFMITPFLAMSNTIDILKAIAEEEGLSPMWLPWGARGGARPDRIRNKAKCMAHMLNIGGDYF